MSSRTRLLRQLSRGEVNSADVARQLGVSVEQVSAMASVLELVDEERAEASRRRSKWLAGLALVGVAVSVPWFASPAWAQSCTQTLPSPMITFCPDSPALAQAVNDNNAALVGFLQQKVGTVGNATLTANNISVPTGNVGIPTGTLSFGNATRQMISLWSPGYGIGVQNSTQYFRTAGGFAWFQNGSHSDVQNSPGGGSVMMTLEGSPARITVNGRRHPAEIVNANCGTASCSASCPAGTVIKEAWGFHGLGTAGTSGDWACGGAISWLGSCVGQTSCTVNTGCGSSAVRAECW